MAKNNFIESIVKIIAVILIFTAVPINGNKIVGKIDLVIIAPCNTERDYMNAFKESIKTLPDHIEMGDEKVRVAVVEPKHGGSNSSVPGARILFNLSSDNAALQEWVTKWTATTWRWEKYYHSEAFKVIRTEVFNFNDKTRAKMIIQVLNGWPFDSDRPKAYEEAKKLRDKGAIIYVTYDKKSPHLTKNDLHRQDAEAYVGKAYPWRMVGSEHSNHKDMFVHALEDILKLGEEITRDMCTVCTFTESQSNCTPGVRPPGSKIDPFGDKNERCGKVKKAAEIQCPMMECELECTRQWPWDHEEPCSVPSIKEHRRVSKDPPLGMENCPMEMICGGGVKGDGPSGSGGLSGTNLALIIIGVVIAVLIIISIVIVLVIISKRKTKKKAEESLKRKKAEEDQKRKNAEDERKRKMAEEDQKRKKAEEDLQKRKKAEAELKRKEQQSEADRTKFQGDQAISVSGKVAEHSVGVSLREAKMVSKKPSAKSVTLSKKMEGSRENRRVP